MQPPGFWQVPDNESALHLSFHLCTGCLLAFDLILKFYLSLLKSWTVWPQAIFPTYKLFHTPSRPMRSSNAAVLVVKNPKNKGKRLPSGPFRLWNNLPEEIRLAKYVSPFKALLKMYFYILAFLWSSVLPSHTTYFIVSVLYCYVLLPCFMSISFFFFIVYWWCYRSYCFMIILLMIPFVCCFLPCKALCKRFLINTASNNNDYYYNDHYY